ncbi:MAG: FKBP-type peptidyl-prolyl cis-trans isomerase, partial [Coriobacteriaceae bacterium]
MSNEGKKVSVHYTGTLDDGTKFDSSYDRNQPLEFTCMAGQMIKGFDEAVRDMEVGQTVNIHLEPSEAYGERREDLIYEFPMEQVPEDMRSLKVGEHVMLQGPMGQPIPA